MIGKTWENNLIKTKLHSNCLGLDFSVTVRTGVITDDDLDLTRLSPLLY